MIRPSAWLAMLAAVLLGACGNGQASPEQQVRDLIAATVAAVEAREVRQVGEFVDPGYSDRRHPSKAAALGSLAAYLRRHRGIHLFHLTRAVEIAAGGARASAVVYVAMTGVPVDSVETLIALKADLYRFDVELVNGGGDWQIVHTAWRRAELSAL